MQDEGRMLGEMTVGDWPIQMFGMTIKKMPTRPSWLPMRTSEPSSVSDTKSVKHQPG
jgi:hypothetical protein